MKHALLECAVVPIANAAADDQTRPTDRAHPPQTALTLH